MTAASSREGPPEQAIVFETMARVRDGDADAFESLYDMLGPSVMRFLVRLCGRRELAEDLTQETFVRVWGAAARWEPRAQVRTWVFEIARRLAWNALAKDSRRRVIRGKSPRSERPDSKRHDAHESGGSVGDWSDRANDSASPDAPLEACELRAALTEAIARLSPRLRLVFILLRLEGCSLRETATIAAIPLGTVKSRAAAAEVRLRSLLHDAGFLPGDAT